MFCNAIITFNAVYFAVGAYGNLIPQYVDLSVAAKSPGDWSKTFLLPLEKLSAAQLIRQCPFLAFDVSLREANKRLLQKLARLLGENQVARGYWFQQPGAVKLYNGTLLFLRGSELLPCQPGTPFMLAPPLGEIELAGTQSTSIENIIAGLQLAPLEALLVIAYVILTSVRSLVLEAGVDLQSVLYIFGGQGLGKTTLATRIAGIYRNSTSKKPAALVQAGSSIAALENLLLNHRDQPVIIDDLCLSVGRETMRKRKELGAKIMREGAGEVPIIKKVGNTVQDLHCNAGAILTAEFSLENMSDLTRCIIVPVEQRLNLPDKLTPEWMGDVIRYFSEWFSINSTQELNRLKDLLDGSWKKKLEPRVRTNYGCLWWAFQSLIASLKDFSVSKEICNELLEKMDEALKMALDKYKALKSEIEDKIPQGNIAFCILSGYQKKAFDLTKKPEKLETHEGTIWEGDLCLRPEVLIRFMRLQPGYHNWSRNRITQELKDIGALVLQEEGSATVHLNKGSPRVYRIRLDVLEDATVYY